MKPLIFSVGSGKVEFPKIKSVFIHVVKLYLSQKIKTILAFSTPSFIFVMDFMGKVIDY